MTFVGWIGLGLLLFAYLLLLTEYKRFFIPVDTIASLILTIHAILIVDVPFIIVNGFITVILSIKWVQKEMEVS